MALDPTKHADWEIAEDSETRMKKIYQLDEELVYMIMVTRLYEANMKFMSVGKDNSKSLMSVAMG